MKPNQTIMLVTSSLLIMLFTYTPISKWINYHDFVKQMNNQPFDPRFLPILIIIVPSLELLTAIMLISDKTRNAGLISSVLLMITFTAYIILIKMNYYGRIPCSCGGVISKLNWTQHLYFNLFFLLLSLVGLLLAFGKKNQLIRK